MDEIFEIEKEIMPIGKIDGEPILSDQIRSVSKLAIEHCIIWVKIEGYPYWPAQIIDLAERDTSNVKLNVSIESEQRRHGGAIVMFFGTYEIAALNQCSSQQSWSLGLDNGLHKNRKYSRSFKNAMEEVVIFCQEKLDYKKQCHCALDSKIKKKPELNRKREDTLNEEERFVANNNNHIPNYSNRKKSVLFKGVKRNQVRKYHHYECDCSSTEAMVCLDETCSNVAMMLTCTKPCTAGVKCQNIAFHERKTPVLQVFHTGNKGWGLKAGEDIQTGQFVIEYIGEIIGVESLIERKKVNYKFGNSYIMDLRNGIFIDGRYKGNKSRFINSSCRPNCVAEKWTNQDTGYDHIAIFAKVDILTEEEMTLYYNFEESTFDLNNKCISNQRNLAFTCKCGSSECLRKKLKK